MPPIRMVHLGTPGLSSVVVTLSCIEKRVRGVFKSAKKGIHLIHNRDRSSCFIQCFLFFLFLFLLLLLSVVWQKKSTQIFASTTCCAHCTKCL